MLFHIMSRMSTSLLLLSALVLGVAAGSDKPKFCHSVDCPPYTIVETGEGYELRRYEKATWATTSISGVDYGRASGTSFRRLFAYISGDNAESKKIPMTAPVLGRVALDKDFEDLGDYEFSFYVPGTIVEPTEESSVAITETPEEFEVYVSWFGGYASASDWDDAVSKLRDDLDSAEVAYETDHFYTAGYDSPFRLFKRHNEVWLVKKGSS